MKSRLAGQRPYVFRLLAFCFFIGIGAGTLWINMMSGELQEQLGAFGHAWAAAGAGKIDISAAQIRSVMIKRETAAVFLWIIGMTLFSLPGILISSAFAGFTMAAVLSLTTLQSGVWALPVYICSVLPQAFFYIPAAAVLIIWAAEQQKKTHLAGFLVLCVLVAAGSLAETCLNPYVMIFLKFLQ